MKKNQNNALIERAKTFARLQHAHQKRMYTGAPYWLHTEAVARIVAMVTDNPIMIAAAHLHDTLEDTTTTYGQLINEFGTGVAELVRQVTNPSVDPDRAVRAKINRAFLADASAAAQTIKLADLIDNTCTIEWYDPEFAKVYLAEKRELLEVLKAGNSKLWDMANDQVKETP
jgi:(p)ppGpp synthase/HD superfamily hydrolase